MDEIMKIDDVEKLICSSKDDIDSIFDENARAQYALAVAKIYETKVKEKELEQQAQKQAFDNQLKEKELEAEKKKNVGELVVKVLDVGLKFVGTTAGIVLPLALYQKCWNEGLEYERTGVFTSSTLKDLRHNLRLKF